MTPEELDDILTYHPPTEAKVAVYDAIRNTARTLAHFINGICPESREKSLALTAVQQAVMWANAAVAIHGKR